MLTAILGGLAPFRIDPGEDLDGDGIIDDFFTRFTDDRVRMVATLAAAVIVGVVMFIWAKKWWQFLISVLVTFLAAWLAWGVTNWAWSPDNQPLFMFPICLDFRSLFSWPLGLWWLLALAAFVAVLSSAKSRGFGTLLKAAAAATASIFVVLVVQYFYREGKAKVEEQQSNAVVTLDVGASR